jgi:hypothetical protein
MPNVSHWGMVAPKHTPWHCSAFRPLCPPPLILPRPAPQISPELGTSYSEVISLQDVALYGGLTALATFDRTELKAKVGPGLRGVGHAAGLHVTALSTWRHTL